MLRGTAGAFKATPQHKPCHCHKRRNIARLVSNCIIYTHFLPFDDVNEIKMCLAFRKKCCGSVIGAWDRNCGEELSTFRLCSKVTNKRCIILSSKFSAFHNVIQAKDFSFIRNACYVAIVTSLGKRKEKKKQPRGLE